MKVFLSQLRSELTVMARNGEQLLLILVIPLGLLVFFSSVDVLPTGSDTAVDFLVPGILALAIMSTAMVSLGIATGFERQYLVLKRLGATPLGARRLIAAKTTAVLMIEVVQIALIALVGRALGWSADAASWLTAGVAVVIATCAFAGIGLVLAGILRAEVNLAAQNAVYLVMLLVGGIVIAEESMPSGLVDVSALLPATALGRVLRDAMAGSSPFGIPAWWVLVAWAIVAPLAAARFFRFAPNQR
ncbi:MAG: ABC transporter permease [Ilumatobacteraceae bacterium]